MLKSKRKKIIKYIVLPIIVVWIIISIAWLLHIQSFNKYYDDNFEHLHQYNNILLLWYLKKLNVLFRDVLYFVNYHLFYIFVLIFY